MYLVFPLALPILPGSASLRCAFHPTNHSRHQPPGLQTWALFPTHSQLGTRTDWFSVKVCLCVLSFHSVGAPPPPKAPRVSRALPGACNLDQQCHLEGNRHKRQHHTLAAVVQGLGKTLLAVAGCLPQALEAMQGLQGLPKCHSCCRCWIQALAGILTLIQLLTTFCLLPSCGLPYYLVSGAHLPYFHPCSFLHFELPQKEVQTPSHHLLA